MPLITCPDCQRQVSDRAPSCIHCGAPLTVAAPAPQRGVATVSSQVHPTESDTDGDAELWQGHPSHWSGFMGYFFGILLLMAAGLGLIIILWQYLTIRCTNYRLGRNRLMVRIGILSRTTEEVELFRVLDFRLDEPFLLRLCGLSNITIVTADSTATAVVLRAIPNAQKIRDLMRQQVLKARQNRRTVSLESLS